MTDSTITLDRAALAWAAVAGKDRKLVDRIFLAALGRADEEGISQWHVDELLHAISPRSNALNHDAVAAAVRVAGEQGLLGPRSTTRRLIINPAFLPTESTGGAYR